MHNPYADPAKKAALPKTRQLFARQDILNTFINFLALCPASSIPQPCGSKWIIFVVICDHKKISRLLVRPAPLRNSDGPTGPFCKSLQCHHSRALELSVGGLPFGRPALRPALRNWLCAPEVLCNFVYLDGCGPCNPRLPDFPAGTRGVFPESSEPFRILRTRVSTAWAKPKK